MTTDQPKVMKVAILAEEPLGWGSGKHYFPTILDGYSWSVDGRSYCFATEYIYDKDILKGRLNINNFDILLVPGGGVGDGEAVTKALTFLGSVRRWKKQIHRFVQAGGGYVGICGGAALMTGLVTGNGKPRSLLERLYDKSALGISCVQSYYKALSLPLFTILQRWYPERVGATAYVFSFAPAKMTDGKYIHAAGVPVDFELSKDNPLFADYPDSQLRMRWWGGPGLIIPDSTARKISILAYYPNPNFCRDPRTDIYAWRYTGGLFGLVRALFRSIRMIFRLSLKFREVLTYAYYLAGRWGRTEKTIDLDCSGRPCMTAEIYPNENQGRIMLCAAHPEYMIWWNGEIEEVEETESSCLGQGLHRWKGITPLSETLEELTHTWWVVRRMAAWAAKVPDADMPPIEKAVLTEGARQIIQNNIYWDGTLLNQMRNI